MKGVFALGYATLIRVFVPGFVFTLAVIPLANQVAVKWGKVSAFQVLGTRDFGDGVLLFLTISAFTGAVFSLLDYYIYQLFEGVLFWPPPPFWSLARGWLKCRVSRWYEEAKQLERNKLTRGEKYDELWKKLKDFPMDEEGNPTVPLPSRVGNIIRAYEDYPYSRYRMESVLYWYRLRLLLKEDTKREMDQASAEADSSLFTVFALHVASATYLLASIGPFIPRVGFPALLSWHGFIVSLIGFTIAQAFYRLSLPLHRRNGEYFKAMFDMYGSMLQGKVEGVPPVEMDQNVWSDLRRRWRYLQFLRIRCEYEGCDELFVPSQPPRNVRCPKCGEYPFKT